MLPNRIVIIMAVVCSLSAFFIQTVIADDNILEVDVRHRPPEMIISGKSYKGPLIDIIKEAAQKNNFQVKLELRQFKGSLSLLKQGVIDILPRTICTIDRAVFIDYLGPIGYQEKDIVFIVHKRKENSINTFEDLKKYRVGTKLGTYYFEKFNNTNEIEKIETADDDNLVQMFTAGRVDTFIVLDKKSAEIALAKHGVSQYSYANYKHTNRIGNYYGIAPDHPAYDRLQKTLEDMVISGRVKEIYQKHGITPPVFNMDLGFKNCFE